MTTEHDDAGFEPPHTSSPTEHVLAELQLYGYHPFQDEPDPRPLPEAQTVAGAVADIFDALVVALADTRLEPDLEDLLWSTVNLFHRATSRIERELDDNEQAQKRSQREQDGSEIRSVELDGDPAAIVHEFLGIYCLTFVWMPPAEESSRAESWLYEGKSRQGVDGKELLKGFADRTDRVFSSSKALSPRPSGSTTKRH